MKNNDLCVICKKEPIKIKKRLLCISCYRKYKENYKEYLCIMCKEKGIEVKKHQLCLKCYYKKMLENKKPTSPGLSNEIEFIRIFFKNNQNWIYHPALFRLPDGQKYTPDFYDIERGCFIEVVGSRQAFSENKNKYKLFRDTYKDIKFEIRRFTGSLHCVEYIKNY